MLDLHREIQILVDRLVAELRELAKRTAINQVNAAFGTSLKSVAAAPSPAPAQRAGGGGRIRRGNDEIEALRGKLLSAISNQPGLRAEDINAALGTRTAQIAQPLRRLVAEKLVRTEGARRGTRYFVAEPPPSRRQSDAASMAQAVAAAAAAATASNAVQASEDTAS